VRRPCVPRARWGRPSTDLGRSSHSITSRYRTDTQEGVTGSGGLGKPTWDGESRARRGPAPVPRRGARSFCRWTAGETGGAPLPAKEGERGSPLGEKRDDDAPRRASARAARAAIRDPPDSGGAERQWRRTRRTPERPLATNQLSCRGAIYDDSFFLAFVDPCYDPENAGRRTAAGVESRATDTPSPRQRTDSTRSSPPAKRRGSRREKARRDFYWFLCFFCGICIS
jgi:hypothetical protein